VSKTGRAFLLYAGRAFLLYACVLRIACCVLLCLNITQFPVQSYANHWHNSIRHWKLCVCLYSVFSMSVYPVSMLDSWRIFVSVALFSDRWIWLVNLQTFCRFSSPIPWRIPNASSWPCPLSQWFHQSLPGCNQHLRGLGLVSWKKSLAVSSLFVVLGSEFSRTGQCPCYTSCGTSKGW